MSNFYCVAGAAILFPNDPALCTGVHLCKQKHMFSYTVAILSEQIFCMAAISLIFGLLQAMRQNGEAAIFIFSPISFRLRVHIAPYDGILFDNRKVYCYYF